MSGDRLRLVTEHPALQVDAEDRDALHAFLSQLLERVDEGAVSSLAVAGTLMDGGTLTYYVIGRQGNIFQLLGGLTHVAGRMNLQIDKYGGDDED